jgi:hypothetical protein
VAFFVARNQQSAYISHTAGVVEWVDTRDLKTDPDESASN